jgi:hypothetical protein
MAVAWELAICYFSGFGVPVSFQHCSDWLAIASKGGIAAAQTFSQPLYAAMGIDYNPPPTSKPVHSHNAARLTDVINEQENSEATLHENLNDEIDLSITEEHQQFADSESLRTAKYETGYHDRGSTRLPDNASRIIELGSLWELQDFLKSGPEFLNSQDDEGNTLLLLAAQQQKRSQLEFLLSQPSIDASICNKLQRTVFHELVSYSDPAIRDLVPRLVENKAEVYHEALPTRGGHDGLEFSAGIRCDSVLNSILHGKLVLLESLLEACHTKQATILCRMCEAGSRFRRTLAISLSIFRADAIEMLVEHVKAHRESHEVDLSRVEVWAGQELLPLHKVPFKSIAVTAMDLPESLFRAINYGDYYERFLEQTIQFVLMTQKSVRDVAYSMLTEAVEKNNIQAINIILRTARTKEFPKRWWLQGPIEFSPLMRSIQFGHREAYQILLKEDPSIFSEHMQLPCWKEPCIHDRPSFSWAGVASLLCGIGKIQEDESRKVMHDINQVQTALNIFVGAPHKDKFFLYGDRFLLFVPTDFQSFSVFTQGMSHY